MGGRCDQAAAGTDRDGARLGEFAKDGSTPCPVVITPDEIYAANKLCQALESAEENERRLRIHVGYEPETWMSVDKYEKAMVSGKEMKQMMLEEYSSENEVMTEDRRAYIVKCWALDDMDEKELDKYM